MRGAAKSAPVDAKASATITPPAQGRDLPRTHRRLGQWTAAVLLVVVMATLAAWLYLQKGGTAEVLVVTRSVPAGAAIEKRDLGTAQVSGIAGAFDVSDVDAIVGMRTVAGLVPGQVLTAAALTDAPVPARGERVVALRLDAGRVPDGLQTGDVVDVLAVPAEGEVDIDAIDTPPVLTERAHLSSVTVAVDGGYLVSVLVPETDATRLAAYAAGGRVTLVQAPLGE